MTEMNNIRKQISMLLYSSTYEKINADLVSLYEELLNCKDQQLAEKDKIISELADKALTKPIYNGKGANYNKKQNKAPETIEEAMNFIVSFKSNENVHGKTMQEAFEVAPGVVKWFAEKSTYPAQKKAAELILEANKQNPKQSNKSSTQIKPNKKLKEIEYIKSQLSEAQINIYKNKYQVEDLIYINDQQLNEIREKLKKVS